MKTFLEYASIKGDANVHIDEDGNLFDLNDDSVLKNLMHLLVLLELENILNPEVQ